MEPGQRIRYFLTKERTSYKLLKVWKKTRLTSWGLLWMRKIQIYISMTIIGWNFRPANWKVRLCNTILELIAFKLMPYFSKEPSLHPVWVSGKQICLPWEYSSNDCPFSSCTVNNERAALSYATDVKCCSIKNTPSKSTNYVINVYGPRDEVRAKVIYTSPKTNEIS
jgi:hypothetical protein